MENNDSAREQLLAAVQRERLLDTAFKLVAVPSRTGDAGAVLELLAELLAADGFQVERQAAGHPRAPAVIVRWHTGKPGRTLQFNGHIDTVHLPFIAPAVNGDNLTGSGSVDMKGGIAAAIEALRALRDANLLEKGGILLTVHDLHETPWGDGSQLNNLISAGCVGDAVLIPEYLSELLPIIGRGGFTWHVSIRRSGAPIHEVMRPNEPSVISAGSKLVQELGELNRQVSQRTHPVAGSESVFIGQIHSGEIFNQYPQECRLEGTRRWLPGTKRDDVERQFRALTDRVAADTGTTITTELHLMRDAFVLDEKASVVDAFQQAYASLSGKRLPIGAKPFCDDGNSFWALANVPAITHGPRGSGAHTLNEWVSINDLVRVAKVYALTALQFCSAG